MIDIASDLKTRFYWAAIWFFERHDMKYGVDSGFHLEAKHAKAVEILDALHDSVDIIPPSLIRTAEALRNGMKTVTNCSLRDLRYQRLSVSQQYALQLEVSLEF